MSRFTWLLVGLLVGAAAATLLARRTAARAAPSTTAPAPTTGQAALPRPARAPAGRHAWVPPSGSTGPSAG